MNFEWFIGIDVSKSTLDFHVRHKQESIIYHQGSNSKTGINSFLSRCKQLRVDFQNCLFCLEHTGLYNEVLVEVLWKKKMNIWVEQGLHIKKSLGMRRGKTDKVDAHRLSEYGSRFQDKCRLWQPVSTSLRQLKHLMVLRNRLIKAKKMLSVPVAELDTHAANQKDKALIKRLNKPILTQLEKQLKAVEQQADELIKQDERLNELEQIITSVDGVGPVTARAIIIATNQFQNITEGRKFACYAGVVPFDHQSGTSIKGRPRLSHFANKEIKTLLHLSALSAAFMKGELNDYYTRKIQEGKNKMLVLNNIRNKLVLRIFACVNQNRKYQKEYLSTLA